MFDLDTAISTGRLGFAMVNQCTKFEISIGSAVTKL